MREIIIRLNCCGTNQKIAINDRAILVGEPNERRRNVVCLGCGKLVILEFSAEDGQAHCVNQEIIDTK